MRKRPAFTLIEILVVVAIIALLISILLPALGRARIEAQSVVCRSSIRQVMTGQLFYVTDFKRLPASISTFYESGCAAPKLTAAEQKSRKELSTWEGGWGVTNDMKASIIPTKGTIFRYTKNTKIYVCPADKTGLPEDIPNGGGGNGFLIYSMNAYLGWKKPEDIRSFTYVADATSRPDPNGRMKLYKRGDRVQFNASTMLTLVEEHPYYHSNSRSAGGYGSGYGEGNFNVTDRIVARHSPTYSNSTIGRGAKGRTNISYLDGHAETRMYAWDTSADQLFVEIGQPVSGTNLDAFLTLCKSGDCPR
jgi:prepilin-type N-terminal cleavage/methylation domain-containing protein/prepilin-type processing-associated H-X9-DG protein